MDSASATTAIGTVIRTNVLIIVAPLNASLSYVDYSTTGKLQLFVEARRPRNQGAGVPDPRAIASIATCSAVCIIALMSVHSPG